MKTKRIEWLDALKGFGIFCVTFAHLSPWQPLENHIYSFHMFLFFFISGYLYRDMPLGTMIKKKTLNLLVPFLLWDALSTLYAVVRGDPVSEAMIRFFVLKGQVCWNSPIWFLLTLFFAEVLYACVMKLIRTKVTAPALALAAAVVWILLGSVKLPLLVNTVPLAIVFYALGDLFHKHEQYFTGPVTVAAIVLFGAVSVLVGGVLNGRISYTGAAYGNIYYCILAGVAGTLFYTLLFKCAGVLGRSKVLKCLGENSMIIMATQYWFFTVFDMLSSRLLQYSAWYTRSTVKAFLVASVTIAATIIPVLLFKKLVHNPKILAAVRYIGIR